MSGSMWAETQRQAEAALATATAEMKSAVARVNALKQTIEGLKAMQEAGLWAGSDVQVEVTLLADGVVTATGEESSPSAVGDDANAGGSGPDVKAHGRQAANLTRPDGLSGRRAGGTAGRVVRVLEDAGMPMDRTAIAEEFANRAASDPSWDKSPGAIHQATYRAVEYGGAVQLPGGKYVAKAYAATVVPPEDPDLAAEPALIGPGSDQEGGD